MASTAPIASHPPTSEEPTRRDFLYIATAATAAVGVAATIWPLIDQMNPDAAAIAAGAPVDIDLAQVQPGQQVTVVWRSKPVFVINRPKAALDTLQSPDLTRRLRDPDSQQRQQPSYAANWHRSIKPEYLVIVGICTHLGCIPKYMPQPSASDPTPDWPGGYFCPCHGSKYDLAGRVFQGVPAPLNLPVPPHHYANDKTLRVGENPPGATFDFDSVEQV